MTTMTPAEIAKHIDATAIEELRRKVVALVVAAQGVIARWDSPDWKSGHTLDHITKLRAAIAPFTGAKP